MRAGATDFCGAPPVTSSMVFHCWHSPHWPTHLLVVQPHSLQRKVLVTRAMG